MNIRMFAIAMCALLAVTATVPMAGAAADTEAEGGALAIAEGGCGGVIGIAGCIADHGGKSACYVLFGNPECTAFVLV